MSEIPEIETMRRHLAQSVKGKKITEVEVFHPQTLNTSPELFQQALITRLHL
ncbi:DNA-formamidopyrimidine glycosylase family protein [Thermosinus carboxydivorans]|uniref:DNA-formamidopyrimidine glycosylase family protein n=1 Tax=Thermosinus carboxydivorans TaxID=261685 RepID=UPI0002F18128